MLGLADFSPQPSVRIRKSRSHQRRQPFPGVFGLEKSPAGSLRVPTFLLELSFDNLVEILDDPDIRLCFSIHKNLRRAVDHL